ncbi:Protein kinase-like domain protein [Niveomyces insectorum RCEF 264]|uniref:Protein kinase-like domain protein n=1 Tax=Niveomyces insectorum RCEF 264 TaxID=1081102 RepID=A0A167YYF5_9HYPO|nr:Protein kinase-like domain protein [Niveomyces insectorum RCEF 264]
MDANQPLPPPPIHQPPETGRALTEDRVPKSKYNRLLMNVLLRRVYTDPELDIMAAFNEVCSQKPEALRESLKRKRKAQPAPMQEESVLQCLRQFDRAVFIHGPTPSLQALLLTAQQRQDQDMGEADDDNEPEEEEEEEEEGTGSSPYSDDKDNEQTLATVLRRLLEAAVTIYEGSSRSTRTVLRISDQLVCKFCSLPSAVNEYHTLVFLETTLPSFPAPRAHGVVEFGCYGLLISDYIAGTDASKAWRIMTPRQKKSFSRQLDALFAPLRAVPWGCGDGDETNTTTSSSPPSSSPSAKTALGGLHGGGCVDRRRPDLAPGTNIYTVADFHKWLLSGAPRVEAPYRTMFQGIMDNFPTPKIVFTHGDLRLENVIVEQVGGADGGAGSASGADSTVSGDWKIRAVIDWEFAGFYPEYWEALFMTFLLFQRTKDDWCL